MKSTSAYGNAQQDDLWQALEEQANIDKVVLPATVKQIMDTWTYKMGYPVVKVVRNYEAGSASVSQVKKQTNIHFDIIEKRSILT